MGRRYTTDVLSITNQSKGISLGDQIAEARSLWSRAVGLLTTRSLALGEGLLLTPCKSVHTFFMRFPIDVIFLDPTGKVLYQISLEPWKMSRYIGDAESVLELPSGTLQRSGTAIGDRLLFKEIS